MPYRDPDDDDNGWYLIVISALILFMFLMAADHFGYEREPTNKSKLCSCVIHVESLPEPTTEEA